MVVRDHSEAEEKQQEVKEEAMMQGGAYGRHRRE